MFKRWGVMLVGMFVLLSVGTAYGATQAETVEIATEGQVRLLSEHVRYWQQPEGVEIESLDQLMDVDWLTMQKASINAGKSKTPVWFYFDIENTNTELVTRLLEIRWINLSVVDFYAIDLESGETSKMEAGLLHERSLGDNSNTSWIFPVHLESGQKKRVYLRVVSRFNLFLPMFVWQVDALDKQQWQRYVWYGLAFGVLGAMLLYNMSLFGFTRDSSYFYYSLYAGSVIMYEAGLTGVGDHLIWGHSQWFRMNGFALSIYVSFFAAALFMRNFLQLKTYGGWVLHLNTFFVGYWLLSAITLLLGKDYLIVVNEIFALISCVVALATSIALWNKGNVSARYFTIAWGGLIALTFVAVLMMEGFLPYVSITENGQLIGFVVEMLLLSFALAERINRERKEREMAQVKALDLQKLISTEREEKLMAQEAMLQMQKETNSQLEARVALRTQELERTMTNLEIANRELAKLSVTDPLTKVHNRRYFDETLAREQERSVRTGQALSLILVDIDHFKQFNDSYGHLVGDDCLRLVASAIGEAASRGSDLVARYGGEEFAIVLPDTTQQEAYQVAERIRDRINHLKFIYKGKRIPISASLGVAGWVMVAGDEQHELIEAADKALYEAKTNGRNCCVLSNLAG